MKASFDRAMMLAGVGKASRKAKNQSLRLFLEFCREVQHPLPI
jgi:hypothetical protein